MRRRFFGLLATLTLLCTVSATAAAEKPYLGVTIAPATDGVEIMSVRPDTAASKAGLKAGDLILALDGKAIESEETLRECLAGHTAGDRIILKLRRGDKKINAVVNLGTWPAELSVEQPQAVKLEEVVETPIVIEQPGTTITLEAPRTGGFLGVMIDAAAEGGAHIVEVRPGSPADRGKLAADDRIIAIDGKTIGSPDDLRKALGGRSAGDEVQITVQRDGKDKLRIVRLASFDDVAWAQEAETAPKPATLQQKIQTRIEEKTAGRKKKSAEEQESGWLGIYYQEHDKGVLIDGTVPGGPAEKAGVEAEDIVISFGNKKVRNSKDLLDLLKKKGPGKKVAVTVMRGKTPMEFDVKLGQKPATDVAFGTEVVPAPPAKPVKSKPETVKKKVAKAKKVRKAKKAKVATAAKTAKSARTAKKSVVVDGKEIDLPAHGSKILIVKTDGKDGVEYELLDPDAHSFAVMVDESKVGKSAFGMASTAPPHGAFEWHEKEGHGDAPHAAHDHPCCGQVFYIENAYFFFGNSDPHMGMFMGGGMPGHPSVKLKKEFHKKTGDGPNVFTLKSTDSGLGYIGIIEEVEEVDPD